jgi:hypothetical protein
MEKEKQLALIELFNRQSFFVTAAKLSLKAMEMPQLELNGVLLNAASGEILSLEKLHLDQFAAVTLEMLTTLKELGHHLELRIVPNNEKESAA